MIKARATKRMGRPLKGATPLMTVVTVRFPPELMSEIEAVMAGRLDRPEKSQVIRELVAEAIAARRAKGRR